MTRFGVYTHCNMSQNARRLNSVHRRNGKLQSCEPCRKGKLRCDHMLPTCSRCARRNLPEQCVYHPAPLTRPKSDISVVPTSAASGLVSPTPTLPSYQLPSLQTSERAARTETPATQPSESGSKPQERELSEYLPSATGFFGATSSVALFADHTNSIRVETDVTSLCVPASVTAARIQRGMEVLALLSDVPFYEKMIARWFKLNPGGVIIEPFVAQWTSELWKSHHKVLRSQDPDGLRSLSELLWRNTQTQLKFDNKTTPREWLSMSTGSNLRWEVVGIIFILVGLLNLTLLDVDPIFDLESGGRINNQKYAVTMCEASESCLSFCRDVGVLNDIVTWFMYENYCLLARIKGKSSYEVWQRTGEFISALFAMGLHQEIKEDENTPFFLTHCRKRQFVIGYIVDKSLSTFLGRPPRLPRRFCLIQMPLDLSDNQLMMDGETLQEVISNLDSEGWNPKGMLHVSTALRVSIQQAQIREDILELSLGISSDGIVEKAARIREHADLMYAALPEFIRREDDNSWNRERDGVEELVTIYVRLEWLHHGFLLQRTLMKRAGADSTELIQIASKMFANILIFINHRDVMRDLQLDLCVIIYYHGLASAAVLAMEIIRQDQDPANVGFRLPRSETIQGLAVFTAALGTLSIPGDRYGVARQGRHFLKGALDKILSAPTPTKYTQHGQYFCVGENDATMANASSIDGSVLNQTVGSSFDFEVPFSFGGDTEFMKLLDSMEGDTEPFQGFTL